MHILPLVTDNTLLESVEGRRIAVEIIFHDQSPQKYGTGLGSNLRPLDLQSDIYLQPETLPTALRGPVVNTCDITKL